VMLSKANGEVIGRRITGQVIGKGEVVIKYEVDDAEVDGVELSVTVLDVAMHGNPWRVHVYDAIQAEAVHVKTIVINGTGQYGFAVTPDGLYFITSNYFSHNISVYSTNNGGCVTTFGSEGSGDGQFVHPYGICATPRGTILVIDIGNGRLQEVTIAGEHVRFHGAGLFDNDDFYGICMQGDTVAVGKYGRSLDERIVLFSYSSGALMRKFGSYGLVKDVRSLSFTPDGRHILVADNMSSRLSMFTVDGAFVNHIGADVIGGGLNYVLCSGSSIFVADSKNDRVCVFSAETGALIRTWGMQGQGDGQFMFISALATHKSKLFVIDKDSSRVQIFE